MAGAPQTGQIVLRNSSWVASGDWPVLSIVTSSVRGPATVLRHRHDPAVRAVDDRDRGAPEALARDQPVTEPVVDLDDAVGVLGEELGRAKLRADYVEAVQEAGVDLLAFTDVRPPSNPLAPVSCVQPAGRRPTRRRGHARLLRHGHDRAGAVGAEHVVGDVDRHRFAVEGLIT